MASLTSICWPPPSGGPLTGCFLPAAAHSYGPESFFLNGVGLAPNSLKHQWGHPFSKKSLGSAFCDHITLLPPSQLTRQRDRIEVLKCQSAQSRSLGLSVRGSADSKGCKTRSRQAAIARAVASEGDSVPPENGQEKSKERGKRIAVFVSGGGSNYKAIQAAIDAGKINGEVVVVVSDKPGCKATEYATERDVEVCAYPKSAKFAPEGLSAETLVELLRQKQVDVVLLAGFLKLLPPQLVKAFPRAILNVHPALLPAFGGKGFYGIHVHFAVIKSGAWFSGPTVHFIDENYDAGVIVAQRIVRVLPTDTPEELQARVLKEEHQLYPIVVAALCEGRIRWREDGVPILEDETLSSAAGSKTSPGRNVQAVI